VSREFFTPRDLTATQVGTEAHLQWITPKRGISNFCSHYYPFDNMGARDFIIATRFTPNCLAFFLVPGGSVLEQVEFISWYENAEFTIFIYTGGSTDPYTPGEVVHEQYVGIVSMTGDFVSIDLDAVVLIPDDEEIWIALHIVTNGGNPASLDSCSGGEGFSNLMYWDGEWTTASVIQGGHASWVIGGIVTSPTQMETLIGYHIYREIYDTEIDDFSKTLLTGMPISDLSYLDIDIPYGIVMYHVSAVYYGGESYACRDFIKNDDVIIDQLPWIEKLDYLYPLGWETPILYAFDDFWGEWGTMWFQVWRSYMISDAGYMGDVWDQGSWLYSPLIKLPHIMDYQSIDLEFRTSLFADVHYSDSRSDFFSVLVSITDKSPDSFKPLFVETIVTRGWHDRIYDLSQYQGNDIYLAFRHGGMSRSQSTVRVGNVSILVTDHSSETDIAITPAYTISAFPNPFNPTTTISFSTKSDGHVNIEIYNAKGQKVKTLIDEHRNAGTHSVTWHGVDDRDMSVGSGIYFYRVISGDFVTTGKLALIK
jgi:hypothetical protein